MKITDVYVRDVGKFTVGFSIRHHRFEILKYPDLILGTEALKVTDFTKMNTWADVEARIKDVCNSYHSKETFVRRVIILQFKSSETKYKVMKKAMFSNDLRSEDCKDSIDDGQGFIMKWCVANEYNVNNKILYKITEGYGKYNLNTLDFDFRLFSDYYGEMRMFSYTDELYNFLIVFKERMANIIQELNNFMDRDEVNFLNNIDKNPLKLLL